MNPVQSDIAPDMGSALAPIANICSTAERQRLLRAHERQYARKLPKHRPELHSQCARILHLDDGGPPDLLQKGQQNSTSDPQAR